MNFIFGPKRFFPKQTVVKIEGNDCLKSIVASHGVNYFSHLIWVFYGYPESSVPSTVVPKSIIKASLNLAFSCMMINI